MSIFLYYHSELFTKIKTRCSSSVGRDELYRSFPTSATFSREDLVMKIFLQTFSLFLFKKSSCQLIAKECTLSTGKFPLGGLPRNSMVRITDRFDMTSAVYNGCNLQQIKQTNVY